MKLFETATKPVSQTLFDCTEEALYTFISDAQSRSSVQGWNDTGGILKILQGTEILDLLAVYGGITLESVKAHAFTYIHTLTRNAQNSLMLAKALMESLSLTGKNTVLMRSDKCSKDGIEMRTVLLRIIIA